MHPSGVAAAMVEEEIYSRCKAIGGTVAHLGKKLETDRCYVTKCVFSLAASSRPGSLGVDDDAMKRSHMTQVGGGQLVRRRRPQPRCCWPAMGCACVCLQMPHQDEEGAHWPNGQQGAVATLLVSDKVLEMRRDSSESGVIARLARSAVAVHCSESPPPPPLLLLRAGEMMPACTTAPLLPAENVSCSSAVAGHDQL